MWGTSISFLTMGASGGKRAGRVAPWLRRGRQPGILACACAVVLAGPAGAAGRLADRHLIHDGGQSRQFEVARDELHAVDARHRHRVVRMAALADAEAVRQRARRLQAATGEEVGPVLYQAGARRDRHSRRILTRQVLVELAPGAEPAEVAAAAGLAIDRPSPCGPRWVILRAAEPAAAPEAAARLRGIAGVLAADPLLARERAKKLVPSDPLFASQWHLRNTGQNGGTSGIDANITGVWDTHTGSGVTIGIVDDGLQFTHPDLAPNANTTIDYDFNDGDANPTPYASNEDWHGTACAGVCAARGSNALGVSGAAPSATLVGLRILAAPVTDAQEADALAHRNDVIAIKSNSWGVPDDGSTLDGPGPLTQAALAQAVQTGRGGKGTIFVFAGGNGLEVGDDSNYDGYANAIETIAVGAVSDRGEQASYSEPGANLVVAAPSSSADGQEITTTDLVGEDGYNWSGASGELADTNYTQTFGGTSSATPLVAGVVALMLNANPQLGWRDVQEILIRSATRNDPLDGDWATNPAGLHFNHKCGAGMVNAQAAVELAGDWSPLGARTTLSAEQRGLSLEIPDEDPAGVTRTFSFDAPHVRVEHVVVTVTATHTARGNLAIQLTSPGGMVSTLAEVHDDPGDNYVGWSFMSVRHWGENAAGTWTVHVADGAPDDTGTLDAVRIDIHGSATGAVPAAGSATLLTEGNVPANAAIDPGETVAVNLGLENTGSAATANLVATLRETGGVTTAGDPQAYGALAPGAGAARSFTFTAAGARGSEVTATLQLQDGAVDLGTASYRLVLGALATTSFSTTNPISIPSSGAASPYPAVIAVSNLSGTVTKVTATLNGLTHDYPDEIDALLAGPAGGSVVLLSDAGTGGEAGNLVLTFDDAAAAALPSYGILSSGTFLPTNHDAPDDIFPAPAPSGPAATLAVFNGLNPNGTWRLFLNDDSYGDGGTLAGGWSLAITTATCTDNTFFEFTGYAVDEGAGTATVTVVRTGGNGGSAAVDYAATAGTATAGSDFTATSGTLEVPAGQLVRSFTVPILDDPADEEPETVILTLANASGNSTLGTRSTAVLTILDDDEPPAGYDAWAADPANGLTPGVDDGPAHDPDADGLCNLLEYVLGGQPTLPDRAHAAPSCALDALGNLVVTFTRSDLSETDTTQVLQSGTDLAGWTDIPIHPPPAGPGVAITEDTPTPGLDTVTVTLPSGDATTLFARLKVTRN